MVDPATTIATGTTTALIKRILDRIDEEHEDEFEEWQLSAIELATVVEARRRAYLDKVRVDRETLQSRLERRGVQAQELAVIGENRDYDDDQVEAVDELAGACMAFATGAIMNEGSTKAQLEDDLDDVVPRIYAFVE